MADVLSIRDLRIEFRRGGIPRRPPVVAVDGLSLTVGEGEIVGLVGESGSGKSTTGLAAAGLVKVASGSVELLGTDVTSVPPRKWKDLRSKIQVILQDPHAALDPRQSVRGGFRELRRRHGSITEWIDDEALIVRVGLEVEHLDRLPHELSGGQAQRVCVARALLLRPRVLVADEPTSSLDVSVQAHILRLLLELRQENGISILFISHDLAVVRAVCDRVFVMHNGRVVESGETESVLTNPQDPYTVALIDALPGAHVPVPRHGVATSDPIGVMLQ